MKEWENDWGLCGGHSLRAHAVWPKHTHTQIITENHDCPYTLLCCPSVLRPLPVLSLSRLQSSTLWDCMEEKPTALSYTSQQNFWFFFLAGNFKSKYRLLTRKHFRLLCYVYSRSQVTNFPSPPLSLSPCLVSSHLSLNRDWPTPKPTHPASSAPTCPATSSRTAWSTSCLSSPPASACSPSVASRAPTTSMPAASTATGQ